VQSAHEGPIVSRMQQSRTEDDDLTEVERRLIDSVARGVRCDLAPGEQIDEASMKRWGASNTVRASVIRDVLRGRHLADPDPHGVQLRGAKIVGRLDLEGMTTGVPLSLTDCYLAEGTNVRGAQLPALQLRHCRAENPSKPPLDAERLNTQVLDLHGLTVISDAGEGGTVRLVGAHIGGNLKLDEGTLTNDTRPALGADNLQVDGSLSLRGFMATGSGYSGAVRLSDAHIGGTLNASGATLTNGAGPALSADRFQVDGGLFLREGFTATGSGDLGSVRLLGAHIGGQLDLSGATLINDTGTALFADGLQIDGGLFLHDWFTATGSGGAGAVRLLGARIAFLAADSRSPSGASTTATSSRRARSNATISVAGSCTKLNRSSNLRPRSATAQR
jgi:hypothetical protein